MKTLVKKHAAADTSIYAEETLLKYDDDIPEELIEHAQEYIETRAESDDMHWHHENVNSWH